MNSIVNDWLRRLDSGEEILLSGFPEFVAAFPEIDFNVLFPSGLSSLANIRLKALSVEMAADNTTLENISYTIGSAESWLFANAYTITLPEVSFIVYLSNTQTPAGSIIGGLMVEGRIEPLPVAVSRNENEWVFKPQPFSENDPW